MLIKALDVRGDHLSRMIGRRIFLGGSAAAAATGSAGPANAEPLKVVESSPADRAVLKGTGSEYYVRFDQPVDHIRSVLLIKQDGKVVETLQPRLKTAPTVLFARAPTLARGSYTFHWSVRTLAGTDVLEGEVSFTVDPDAR
jgi:methionine-rich copper-binding protein CopC